jgi:hypothetical protein
MPQSETLEEADRLKKFWKPRNDRWLHLRELVAGTYRTPIKNYVQILSNEPKVLVDLSVSVISGEPPEIRIPIIQEEEQDRRPMNKTERFLASVYQVWGRNHRHSLHGNWLEEAAWYALMGAISLFPHMVKGAKSGLDFRCDIFDPMDVYPDIGGSGTMQVIRCYNTTVADARAMAQGNGWKDANLENLGDNAAEIEVVNRWYEEDGKIWNSISFLNDKDTNGRDVLNPIERPEFDTIPVLIYGSNGVPYRAFSNAKQPEGGNGRLPDWREQWGRPIVDANAEIYKAFDSLLTWDGQITKDTAYPTYLHKTQSGQSMLTGKNMQLQDIQLIAGKQGDSIEAVLPGQSPAERSELFQYLRGAMQRGGVSDVATGQLGLEVSGVTLDQLISSTTGKHRPYVNTLEEAMGEAFMITQKLFKGSRRKVELDRIDADMGFFHEEFTQADIPHTTGVKVTLAGAILDKTLQILTQMQIALPGQPLMDYVTAAEQLGHRIIPDAAMVKGRMAEDRLQADPRVVAAGIRTAMRRKIRQLQELGAADPNSFATEEAEELQKILDADLGIEQGNGTGGGPQAPQNPRSEVRSPEGGVLPAGEIEQLKAQGGNPPLTNSQRRFKNVGLT